MHDATARALRRVDGEARIPAATAIYSYACIDAAATWCTGAVVGADLSGGSFFPPILTRGRQPAGLFTREGKVAAARGQRQQTGFGDGIFSRDGDVPPSLLQRCK